MLCLLLAFLGLTAVAAQPWPEPGEGFVWENVGDRPIDGRRLAFDAQGRLWAAAVVDVLRLDPHGDVWDVFDPLRGGDHVLPLGRGDTTLSAFVDIRRTTDDGATWAEVGEPNAQTLYEVPYAPGPPGGLPGDLRGGHLLAAGVDGLARSPDRGATWAEVPGLPVDSGVGVGAVLVLPAGHPHAGRLIAVTYRYGAYLGATGVDGGLVVERTAESEANPRRALEHLALFPSGRVLATGYVGGEADNRAFVSDDGGETWRETARLPEPVEGIPGDAWILLLGGPSALAVGGRGIIYRTDDEGETWAVVGRTPVAEGLMTSQELVIGPEGRLYVGLSLAGSDEAWVVRTASPVVVAGEAAPEAEPEAEPEATRVALTVAPNPAGSATQVRLTLASPEAEVRVSVFDARGREVSVLASGARGAGGHAFRVDTSALAPGVYVVRAVLAGGRASARFVVSR